MKQNTTVLYANQMYILELGNQVGNHIFYLFNGLVL